MMAMATTMSRAIATTLTALLLAAGCGETKDWDQEIILQLFKPKGTKVGTVTVEASQTGVSPRRPSKEINDASFADCEANKLRIIPRQVSGSFPPVTVKVTAKGHGTTERQVSVPASNPVPIVIGTATSLEPAACAPKVKPDGGMDDGAMSLSIGSPCTNNNQCKGGLCITSILNDGNPINLVGGYCSQDCATSSCPADGYCWTNKDGLGNVKGKVCLRSCSGPGTCSRPGFDCTPGGVCLPK